MPATDTITGCDVGATSALGRGRGRNEKTWKRIADLHAFFVGFVMEPFSAT